MFHLPFKKKCLFERDSERTHRVGRARGQREGRESESEAESVLNTEPTLGLDLTTLRLGTEPKPRVRGLTDCITLVICLLKHLVIASYLVHSPV